MTQPRSNSRRFVSAAWSLLIFQLIASAGAVAVTGYAALHVRNLVYNAQQRMEPVEAAIEAPAAAAPAPSDAVAPAAPAPADGVAPQPPRPDLPNAAPGTLSLGPDGATLYLSFNDPDGVSATNQIQWVRNGAVIPGATGTSYDMSYADSNSDIYVRAIYVDGRGLTKVATSNTVRAPVFTP
jgi:hypothetical protein